MRDRELQRLRSRLRAIGTRSYGVPEGDLDDVVQTTFLLYWARHDEVEHPKAWIVATFRRQCLMYWRAVRARREEESGLEVEPAEARETRPGRDAGSRLALRSALEGALATLPERQQRLVRLRIVHGLSTSEAAAELGYSRGSIKQTLRRTLARLRRALESSAPPATAQRSMTSRELAEATGVPVQTVEHYRRRGLLPVVGSGKTSRLLYPEAVETLRRIRRPRGRPPTKPRAAPRRTARRTDRAPATGR